MGHAHSGSRLLSDACMYSYVPVHGIRKPHLQCQVVACSLLLIPLRLLCPRLLLSGVLQRCCRRIQCTIRLHPYAFLLACQRRTPSRVCGCRGSLMRLHLCDRELLGLGCESLGGASCIQGILQTAARTQVLSQATVQGAILGVWAAGGGASRARSACICSSCAWRFACLAASLCCLLACGRQGRSVSRGQGFGRGPGGGSRACPSCLRRFLAASILACEL